MVPQNPMVNRASRNGLKRARALIGKTGLEINAIPYDFLNREAYLEPELIFMMMSWKRPQTSNLTSWKYMCICRNRCINFSMY